MVFGRDIGAARVLAVVSMAVAPAGCDCIGRGLSVTRSAGAGVAGKPIPLPRRALLAPQPAPSCEPEGAEALDERQKLDYQRQCYRHAGMIARERLQALQVSVDRTVKALKEDERGKSRGGAP
jgi:hypothetical protein